MRFWTGHPRMRGEHAGIERVVAGGVNPREDGAQPFLDAFLGGERSGVLG